MKVRTVSLTPPGSVSIPTSHAKNLEEFQSEKDKAHKSKLKA